MFAIRKITFHDITICGEIMRSLPNWFGIESSTRNYLTTLSQLDGFVVEAESNIVGFVGMKRYGDHAIEIDVIAVKPQFRGQGVGKLLLKTIEEQAVTPKTKLIHTKTLAPTHPDTYYAETRKFWDSMGFIPMDSHELWGEDNPCLVLVKPL